MSEPAEGTQVRQRDLGERTRSHDLTPFAASLANVPYTRIRELAELAMSMDGVHRLYFGESNLPTPGFIVAAAVRALKEGYTFYSENAGLPALRREIADHYRRLHDVELDPQREIVITASGVEALHLAIRTVIDPGDEAIVLSPAWPNSASIIALSHGSPVDVPLRLAGQRYEIDFAALGAAISARTRLVILTSPSNPLGWVADVDEQRRLLELCRERGLWLLADEVYERIYYGGSEIGDPAPSILRLCDRDDAVHVVQSFSKTYCMTGWRVGWLVTRDDLGSKVAQLNEFFVSHAATFAQVAARAALADGEGELRRMIESLKANRDFCVTALREMPGVTLPEPRGAFYAFPRIDGLDDSIEFCRRLLLERRVGLAPGSAFGAGGEGSVRICYAAERAVLEPALEHLDSFIRAGL
ncbi:MAG: aminotransferase class I/II-fold pyridoxal phosphate-dependent enzyme [Actinobacteria bacterium]|nr:MAG: aminotransferase class I/II-fold pyridoxal phosphate-dependent enzyme [Actinomycetota bacterium]